VCVAITALGRAKQAATGTTCRDFSPAFLKVWGLGSEPEPASDEQDVQRPATSARGSPEKGLVREAAAEAAEAPVQPVAASHLEQTWSARGRPEEPAIQGRPSGDRVAG